MPCKAEAIDKSLRDINSFSRTSSLSVTNVTTLCDLADSEESLGLSREALIDCFFELFIEDSPS